MYLNRLTLIGFVGGDAGTKTISNGSTLSQFSVAPAPKVIKVFRDARLLTFAFD